MPWALALETISFWGASARGGAPPWIEARASPLQQRLARCAAVPCSLGSPDGRELLDSWSGWPERVIPGQRWYWMHPPLSGRRRRPCRRSYKGVERGRSKQNRLNLILCGSSVIFTGELLAEQNPFGGHQSAGLDLGSLSHRKAGEVFPEWTAEYRLRAYGIFGEILYPLHMRDPNRNRNARFFWMLRFSCLTADSCSRTPPPPR